MSTNRIDNRFIVVRVGERNYCVPIKNIKEVVKMRPITPIPEAPKYFPGIINLRGKVHSVLDMRLRLDSGKDEILDTTVILIVELMDVVVGFIVDEVVAVENIAPEHIDEEGIVDHSTAKVYISGVVKREEYDSLILVLDLERTITPDEFTMIRNRAELRAS